MIRAKRTGKDVIKNDTVPKKIGHLSKNTLRPARFVSIDAERVVTQGRFSKVTFQHETFIVVVGSI